MLGVILAAAGMIAMAGCVVATIARRRAPGMSLLRMPVFTWTELASMLMVVAAFPALIVAMSLLYVDRHGGRIYTGFNGTIDYQDLFWFFGHPVVYVMFFPYLGAAAEAIATSARKKWFGYVAFVASIMAFAALSMSVWAHHMFVTGGVTNQYFAFTSTLLIIPAGIEYFDMIATLIGGSLVLRTSMLFGLAFFLQFLIGGLSGIFVSSPVLDYHANNSYFLIAHFHYTLFAGSVFGFFAGVYHWFPKLTGALLRESLGKLHLVLLVIGSNLTFFPMFFLGAQGMPRRISRYPTHPGWGTLNLIESIGAGIIALGVLTLHRQRGRLAASTRARGGRPMARAHAGMGDLLAAAATELRHRAPADPLVHAAAGPSPRGRGPRGPTGAGRGMRGGAIPLLAWGTLLLVLYVGNWIWEGRPVEVGVTLLAVGVVYAGAGLLWLLRREAIKRGPPPADPEPEPLPTASLASVSAGLSVGMILFGLAWAQFLILFGLATLIASLGRLSLEVRAERRDRERVRQRRAG